MRILFLTDRLPCQEDKSGADGINEYLIPGLAESVTVDVVAYEFGGRETDYLARNRNFHVSLVKGKRRLSPIIKLLLTLLLVPYEAVEFYTRRYKETVFELMRRNAYQVIYCDLLFFRQFVSTEGEYKVVVAPHDCLTMLTRRMARATKSYMRRVYLALRYLALARYENKIFTSSDKVLFVSSVDEAFSNRGGSFTNLMTIPLGIDVDHLVPCPRTENACVLGFVGNFSYKPNVDAMVYFLGEILPLVTSQQADVRMLVVGGNVPPELLRFESRAVTFTGFVPDLRESLSLVDVFVSPLRFGSGMKTKMLTAMSLELPIVCTSCSREGIDGLGTDGPLFVRDGAREFAEAILHLLRDKSLRLSIGQNMREFVVERYSWQRIIERHTSLLMSLAEDGK